MKKRVLGLTLALSMAAASLASCSGDGTAETMTTVASDTTTVAAAETTAAVTAAGGTVPKRAVWDVNLTTYYQPLIDELEAANPGVKAETVDLGSADYQIILATELIGSGSNSDVVTIKDIPGHVTLINKDVLEPLDDYIAEDNVDLSAYGGMTDQTAMNDKLYELPFRSDFWVVFYNKDVFDNAGVTYPINDATFEQYDELARSVASTTSGQEVYGAHYHTRHSAIQLFGVLDGKNFIVNGTYDFLKPYHKMVPVEQNDGVCQDYAILETSSLYYSGVFTQDNIAMIDVGTWYVPTLIDRLKSGEYGPGVVDQGIVRYPHAEGVEPDAILSAIAPPTIPTSASNKDLTWEFLKYVYGPDGAETIVETGTFPATQTNAVIEAISSLEGFPGDEGSAEALKAAKIYLKIPTHSKSAGIEIALNEAYNAIMTEGSTINEGIAQMDKQVGVILAQ